MIQKTFGYKEQQEIDRVAPAMLGITLRDLAERAAAAVVRECLSCLHDDRQPIAVVAGPGNNGADAYAAARMLVRLGRRTVLVEGLPGKTRSPMAEAERQLAIHSGVIFSSHLPADSSNWLLIDGLFGAGFDSHRPLEEKVTQLLRDMNRLAYQGSAVIAVDIPSGVDSETGSACPDAVNADATVTFVCPRTGLFLYPGKTLAGRVVVDGLGLPEGLPAQILSDFPPLPEILDISLVRSLCPHRPAAGHKGTFGRVLVIGGSPGMSGAVTLATGAALRSGAGMVHALIPVSSRAGLDARHPEALVHATDPFPPSASQTSLLATGKQAVLIGPGLYPDASAADLVELLAGLPVPLVLDAGALTCIAGGRDRFFPLLKKRLSSGLPPAVLTPHPGEFARLWPDADPSDSVTASRVLAALTGCVVVLKGAGTTLAAPDGSVRINTTGNDGMAKGGSGDVLGGLLAGLLAQGMPPWEAACSAVFLHGLAADMAAIRVGRRAMLPGDLALYFGEAFHKAGWESER